jgi:hypothetical protein
MMFPVRQDLCQGCCPTAASDDTETHIWVLLLVIF